MAYFHHLGVCCFSFGCARRIELYAPEPMTPRLEELIAEVESELNAGKASKPFENVDDFLADLKQ